MDNKPFDIQGTRQNVFQQKKKEKWNRVVLLSVKILTVENPTDIETQAYIPADHDNLFVQHSHPTRTITRDKNFEFFFVF